MNMSDAREQMRVLLGGVFAQPVVHRPPRPGLGRHGENDEIIDAGLGGTGFQIIYQPGAVHFQMIMTADVGGRKRRDAFRIGMGVKIENRQEKDPLESAAGKRPSAVRQIEKEREQPV